MVYRLSGPGYSVPKKGVRKVHINGVEYRYLIGSFMVVFFLDDGKVGVPWPDVVGMDWNVIERGQWRKTSDGTVHPRQVKAWLESYLSRDVAEEGA